MIPPHFYNFCFNKLGVETITAEVFFSNINTIKLHLLHGYRFTPRKDHIIKKGGVDILMVCLELKKSIFHKSKYSRSKGDFPIAKWKFRELVNG